MIYKDILLATLFTMPDSCVYALVNENGKKAYVGYAFNFLDALNRNVKLLRNKQHVCSKDFEHLELKILEPIKNSKDLIVRYHYWSSKFLEDGYSLYRKYTPLKYRVVKDIVRDYRSPHSTNVLFRVQLVSRRYRKITVGIFDDIATMDKWTAKAYRNGVSRMVVADNELTKEYLKNE